MNAFLVLVLAIIVGEYLLDLIVEILNIRHIQDKLPDEFSDVYDAAKYKRSQDYLKDNTRFSLLKSGIMTFITVVFILIGGFNYFDQFARAFSFGPILTGLIFAGLLVYASQIINIPFSVYRTFVIEAKYGFNRTTIKTFILDLLKAWVLTAIIGGIIFSIIILFFLKTGSLAWIYCWIAVTLFSLFLQFIAPVVIMPLFNKFIPLEDGELKTEINNYADSQKFQLSGIFKIDASRRSSKSNAFFTGFGKFRRIALFDTLIQKHTIGELVSVLAHEIGHSKLKHIIKSLVISILTSGLMFFILSLFINNESLFNAFKMQDLSIYGSLLFFGFLYAPINMLFSVVGSVLSRKHEYEADDYAISTYKKPQDFIAALKKLSADNLSNLTPHPLKVFLYYSHPPVLERIKSIKEKIA